MIIGTARNQTQPSCGECLGKGLRICDDLLLIRFEVLVQSLAERDRLCGNNVHKRATLDAGKHASIEIFRKFLATQY